jgi:hypothetical protein
VWWVHSITTLAQSMCIYIGVVIFYCVMSLAQCSGALGLHVPAVTVQNLCLD